MGGEAARPRHAVVLVHGTRLFGMKPTWTRPGSRLRTQLERRFGASMHLSTVDWSGRNTHGARSAAAEKVRARLRNNLDRFPESEHVLICHSHAGNAALYALRDKALADRVRVVALATPFLVARRRDFGPQGLMYFSACVLIAAWAGLWLIERTSWHQGLPSFWRGVTGYGAMAAMLGVAGALAWFWYRRAERLLEGMRLAALPRDRLLIVRTPGDEASSALSAFQFVVQLCTRIFSLASGAHRRTALWIRQLSTARALGVVLVGFLGTLGALTAGFLVSHLLVRVAAFVLAGVLLMTVAMVLPKLLGFGDMNSILLAFVAGALLWPILLVLSLLLLPFGWQIAVANVLLDVTVEATPLGEWETHLCKPLTIEESGVLTAPLGHSSVYENPAVLDLICSFIERGSG